MTDARRPTDRERRTRLALRLAAAGARRRRREEPAGAAAGIAWPPSGSATPCHAPTVGMRTGDTPADERRQLVRHPPDILITTPESLYLMLTSQAPRDAARRRGGDRRRDPRRGGHQAGRAPRPDAWSGWSAVVRPARRSASACRPRSARSTRSPASSAAQDGRAGPGRSRSSTPACARSSSSRSSSRSRTWARWARSSTSRVSGPAAAGPARRCIWPAIHPRLLELDPGAPLDARSSSTPAAWPSGWPPASTSWRSRARTAPARQTGDRRRPGHELGEGPPRLAVARAAAADRGRAQGGAAAGPGRHRLASSSASTWAPSTSSCRSSRPARWPRACSASAGPATRSASRAGASSSPSTAATWSRRPWSSSACTQGLIEETRYPRNPLDVLAQQIVAMCALDEWTVDDLAAVVRRAANFAELSDDVLHARARPAGRPLPVRGVRRAAPPHRVGPRRRRRPGPGRRPAPGRHQRAAPSPTAACSACSCPTAPGSASSTRRWSTRAGPARRSCSARRTWRIEDITLDRVVVTPAPGPAGQDAVLARRRARAGRSSWAGRSARSSASCATRRPATPQSTGCRRDHGLDDWAAANLVAYLDEQAEATGAVPDDRTIVVERFRDEIGDWRVCVLSPFGAQVHAPWAMALAAPARPSAGASRSR